MEETNIKPMRFRRPILICSLVISLTGCHPQPPAGLPAPTAVLASPGDQSQVEQIAQGYLKSLQAQDYQKAEAVMSPAFRAATPPARLEMLLKGPDQPLLGAKNLQFDPVQLPTHGFHIVLRTRFLGSDGKPYRTNFLLTKSGSSWQVSGLIPPATHKALVGQHVHTSSA